MRKVLTSFLPSRGFDVVNYVMDKGMEYPADIGHIGRRMTFLAKDPLPALWPSKFLLSCRNEKPEVYRLFHGLETTTG